MKDKLAIKRLKQSDLSFFDWHYKQRQVSKQKAINLNKNVFTSQFYPLLEHIGTKFPLDLYMYGPGLAAECFELRNVILQEKNWRLNGKTIDNPPEEPERFNVLREDDLAIMDFVGDTSPTSAYIVFVAAAVAEDRALYDAINPLVGRQRSDSMVNLDRERLASLVGDAGVGQTHPVNELFLRKDLEEAAAGDDMAVQRLLGRRSGRKVSIEQLYRARESADHNGSEGERLVNLYLEGLERTGEVLDYTWASRENALSPYDFQLTDADGSTYNIDVKSTSGDFRSPIFVSLSELRVMAEPDLPYLIYRVSNLVEDAGTLRVSEPVSDFATRVLRSLENVPAGVTISTLSIKPDLLGLGQAIPLSDEADEHEDEAGDDGA